MSDNNTNQKKSLSTFRKMPIRQHQLVTTYGPGQVITFGNRSMVISSPSFWKEQWKRYSRRSPKVNLDEKEFIEDNYRVKRRLGIEYGDLILPMEYRINETHDKQLKNIQLQIYMFNFPKIGYCEECEVISEYNKEHKAKNEYLCVRCLEKKDSFNKPVEKKLIRFKYCVVCPAGHMEDFDYFAYVHEGEDNACTTRDKATIKFKTKDGADYLKCSGCSKERDFAGIVNYHEMVKLNCKGESPWTDGSAKMKCPITEKDREANNNLRPRIVLLSSSNIHYPIIRSIIHFPDLDFDDLLEVIDDGTIRNIIYFLKKNKERLEKNEISKDRFDEDFDREVKEIHNRVKNDSKFSRFSKDNIINYLNYTITNENNESISTSDSELYDEFQFFTTQGDSFENKDLSFNRQDKSLFKVLSNEPIIKNIFLVSALKEYVVNKGFSRIYDFGDEESVPRLSGQEWCNEQYFSKLMFNEKTLREDYVFPYCHNRGEGIFIEFDNEYLEEWASNENLLKRISSKKDDIPHEKILIKTLLHTFAHMMINSMSFESGYSTVSMKERIYYSENQDFTGMAGILIYTSSSSSEGSLGGLVRLGEPGRLDDIFVKGIEFLAWCTMDPLCITKPKASCHNCTHLTEVSCGLNNNLLDRALLIGTLEDKGLSALNIIKK